MNPATIEFRHMALSEHTHTHTHVDFIAKNKCLDHTPTTMVISSIQWDFPSELYLLTLSPVGDESAIFLHSW